MQIGRKHFIIISLIRIPLCWNSKLKTYIGCGFEKGGETPQKLKGNVRKRSHKLRKTERQGGIQSGQLEENNVSIVLYKITHQRTTDMYVNAHLVWSV